MAPVRVFNPDKGGLFVTIKSSETYRRTLLQILVDGVFDFVGVLRPVFSAAQKVAGKKMPVAWSLPAGKDFSCRGETNACRYRCYAAEGHHIFNSAFHKVILRNWFWLKECRSRGDVEGPARQLASMILTWFFRIHESGDFEKQYDVDLWTRVAEIRPDVSFWFYTRTFDLDYSRLLALLNVQGFSSADRDNRRKAKAFRDKYSHLGVLLAWGPWDLQSQVQHYNGTGSSFPPNSFICPAVSGKLEMDSACIKCKLCIVKGRIRKDVVFPAHTGRKKDWFIPESDLR